MKKQASHSTSVSPERSLQIEKRYLAYALAAGGTALVTAPAKAEIVNTPTHKVVDTPGALMVDLNNDRISDIKLDNFDVFGSSSGSIIQLGIRGAQNPSARVIGKKAGFPFSSVVFPAPYGFSIGPNTPKSFLGPLRTASGPAMVGGRFFAGSLSSFFGLWLNATQWTASLRVGQIDGENPSRPLPTRTHQGDTHWIRLRDSAEYRDSSGRRRA